MILWGNGYEFCGTEAEAWETGGSVHGGTWLRRLRHGMAFIGEKRVKRYG